VQSGGQARIPGNHLSSELAKCIPDANSYYAISFMTPSADGPNELKLRVDKAWPDRADHYRLLQPATRN